MLNLCTWICDQIWTPCQKSQRMSSNCETDYNIQSPSCLFFPHCAWVGGISDIRELLARAKVPTPVVPSADQRGAHLCLLYMQAVQLSRPITERLTSVKNSTLTVLSAAERLIGDMYHIYWQVIVMNWIKLMGVTKCCQKLRRPSKFWSTIL